MEAIGIMLLVTLGLVFAHQTCLAADYPVDINHASLEELTSLKYVGEIIAKRIVEFREKMDGFKSVTSIQDVKGIGPKNLEAYKARIVISPK